MSSESNADEETFDADRTDEEAEEIAAERVRSGAAEEALDGIAALEGLGVSFSAQAIQERLGHEPATLAAFEAAHGPVKPPDGEG